MRVHIRLLFLDKGFYSHEVIRKLKTLRVNFLIAIPKNRRMKEAILEYFRTGEEQMRRFSLEKVGETGSFNLTIHRLRRRKRNLRNVLKLYGAFATNLGFKRVLRVRDALPRDYRRRWGIETSFRLRRRARTRLSGRYTTNTPSS